MSAVVGVILSVHTSVGTNPIIYFGNDDQKKRYLPKLASGEYLGAFCLTEASSGSDAGSLKTRAVKKGDHYVLNGSKMFITNGGEADVYIVFASTDPSKGHMASQRLSSIKIHRVWASEKTSGRWGCMDHVPSSYPSTI